MKIMVLLSTYNGEKYISEQIESVLCQQGVDVHIVARDDGSQDETINILKRISTLENITVIEGQNIGVVGSFFKLMHEAVCHNFDYFAFCDQDDVWKNDKLKVATDILSGHGNEPALYMSSFQMVDENLHSIQTNMSRPNISVEGAIASNCATGCTMVFNKKLLEKSLISNYDDVLMHDYWMYMVCLLTGGYIYYDETPHIYYRQHGNNVIGGTGDNFLTKWWTRMNKMFLPGDNFKSKFACKLLEQYGNEISEDKKVFLQNIANIKTLKSKWNLLRNKKLLTGNIDKRLQLIGLILTGKL